MAIAKPVFLDNDPQSIIDAMVTDYETATGKSLAPGQAEMLLINAFAYRESLVRASIQYAAEQNLVDFAAAPALDWLGVLVGVTRLPASVALCTIQLTLVNGHNSLVIPSGIRIQSIDGQVIFITTESKSVDVSTNIINVAAECQTEGVTGNDYAIGQISVILDPQPYLTAASNIDATSGGSVEETDDALRARVKSAPGSFSNAGSIEAYIYWAKTAHPLIEDVSITSPTPGTVVIYPLLQGGVAPSDEIIDAVFASCNADKVRPLTDTVSVQAPTAIDYDIVVNLTLLTDAIQSDILTQVNKALETYTTDRKSRMAVDVVRSQIIKNCNVDGVYNTEVVSPTMDLIVDEGQFANIGNITINVVGTSDE
jgi:phage-related baseplate assembly protein